MIKYSHAEIEKDYKARENFLATNNRKYLAELIDSTLLKADLLKSQIEVLCHEAIEHRFKSICIPQTYLSFAKDIFLNSITKSEQTKICTVISFPLGYTTTEAKVKEIEIALQKGADEIDFVQNITFVKNGDFISLEHEFLALAKAAQNKVTKVILETALLTSDEIFKCTFLAAKCGIHIIKTSTGFSHRGVSTEDIRIIKNALETHQKETGIILGIKASGGVRSLKEAYELVNLGATRLGTSGGVVILQDKTNVNNY
ncbi:deoxyribose-phosphate aldolase [Fluviispira sanaruensis]|uniref:Deoxyribose-phosphate aldolase n=1 Tax=Fluviispira sanaruensis TaxID=2493639 RepID=A0A4P2VK81_FLUSA|nr:deoxyribose-phosphate aldolase [Fluviispira sanaruensis]BBH53636.1 deoxyribose-phosphate aldolase [Fluviispira sanaruensis]